MCSTCRNRGCARCRRPSRSTPNSIKRHAGQVLGDVADAAKKAGVACDTVQIEHDHPYEAIIKTANDKGCDAIVMASHGRSGISAVLLGSVTNKVLTHTAIPVVVVH